MIYLYAITRYKDRPLPNITGVMGHALEKFRVGEIEMVISKWEQTFDAPNTATLWKHESVIETLMKNQCVLPVRYGVCIDDLLVLQQFVQKEEKSLLADLDRLEGCVEISLRVINPARKKNTDRQQASLENADKDGQGRAYLKTRLSEMKAQLEDQKRLEKWVDTVHHRLLENALEGNLQVHTHPLLMSSGAYLVKKKELFAFQQQVGKMRDVHKEYKFLCTGPWPPYNFVTPTTLGIAVN